MVLAFLFSIVNHKHEIEYAQITNRIKKLLNLFQFLSIKIQWETNRDRKRGNNVVYCAIDR